MTTAARQRLAVLPTPVHRLAGLERALGLPPIWVKRDDLTGFSLAGNKIRPLEFLLGDALAQGAGVFVTGGAPDSNYCAAAAVACAHVGLDYEWVVAAPEGVQSPNLRIAEVAGAHLTYTGVGDRSAADAAIERRAQSLRGRRPYVAPRGGATAIGALGFAHAAAELDAQLADLGVGARQVVVATGSGGTLAGLLAGVAAGGLPWRVQGASVSRPPDQLADQVFALAGECARLLGAANPVQRASVQLTDARGLGFGRADDRDQALAAQALVSDGLLLDPTYTAKGLRVALDLARVADAPIVFWHTGGTVSALKALAFEGPSSGGSA